MKTLLIIAVLILILWNLGAGLYYMLVDKGESKRTVNALTRRIALSVALILGVVIADQDGLDQVPRRRPQSVSPHRADRYDSRNCSPKKQQARDRGFPASARAFVCRAYST